MNAEERGGGANNATNEAVLTRPPEGEEQALCLSCLQPNTPQANFCVSCGAPITPYAATGPFEGLFAEGYTIRRAAEQPRNWIVLIGVWLFFLPLAALGFFVAFSPFLGAQPDPLLQLAGVGALIFAAFAIGRTTLNFRERRRLG